MADETSKTASEVINKKLMRLGLEVYIDEKASMKSVDPALRSLTRKLNELSKASMMEKEGVFGKNFFTDKVKAFTGFDLTLIKATKNFIAMGRASKEMDADNQKYYKSLSPISKLMIDMVGIFGRKSKAEKEAADATRKTKEQEGSLDEQAKKLEMINNLTHSTEGIAGNMGVLGEETASVAGGLSKIVPAAEEAGAAVARFEAVATAGLAVVAMLIIGIGKGFYSMFMQAVTARAEIKKFDYLFGGVGAKGVAEIGTQLQGLNNKLWGLGLSLEKVNEVVLSATAGGLNFSRAIDSNLVESVLTLSGATNVAASEIGGLYTELLKTTQIDVSSLTKMGDGLIQMNQYIKGTKTLGQISFNQLAESIKSSSNALGIATAKGKTFTDSMIKDLTSLTTLASTLSISIGELNSKFEEAGSMISNQESGFRTLLAISGGANINQMITNQFDKTDAMLKGITYLQELNKGFGNNIALTAQVAERSLGISKEMAIKMINMRQDAIEDMKKAQSEMSSMQTQTAKDAFNKVNSDLSSMWDRIKNMFVTFFQNAFGNNSGIQGLLARVEGFLGSLRSYMENAGWIEKLRTVIGNLATWIAGKLDPLLTWIGDKLNDFMDPNKSVVDSFLGVLIDYLHLQMRILGKLFGEGIAAGIFASTPVGMLYNWIADKTGNKNIPDNIMSTQDSELSSLHKQAGEHSSKISDISAKRAALDKYSPETVTYGKMKDANGKDTAGFMTVGQKEAQLDEQKEKEQAELKVIQENIEEHTKQAAITLKELAERKKEQNMFLSAPDPNSPVTGGVTRGYMDYGIPG